jgi:hypothetical protein
MTSVNALIDICLTATNILVCMTKLKRNQNQHKTGNIITPQTSQIQDQASASLL